MVAIALMLGVGLSTAWPDVGCQAATASQEGRSHR
jgi:hypothetical protein